MHAYLHTERGHPVVVVAGDLELRTKHLADELLADVEADRPEIVIFDLREVTSIDSSGLHLLLHARERSIANGYRLVLVHPPAIVGRAFVVTRLDGLFEWVTDPALVDI